MRASAPSSCVKWSWSSGVCSGHPDHILIQKGVCETQDYQRLRSTGFIYATAQPNTQPLYRCYSAAEHSHFTSNGEGCHNMGKRQALLGYDIKE